MSEKLVPKRQYTDEFKVEATRLAESVGPHEAAHRLGAPVAVPVQMADVNGNSGLTELGRTTPDEHGRFTDIATESIGRPASMAPRRRPH